LAAGQQRIRPNFSTSLSSRGLILALKITVKRLAGRGVVIIFGIGFATVLTLVVVPVMYALFEGLGYYVTSAFRGPRFQSMPQGTSFFLSRRRHAKFWVALIILAQIAAFAAGGYLLAPEVIRIVSTAHFQAPNLIKLMIEVVVFVLALGLQGVVVLLALMLPTWAGLFFLMGRRTAEGHYADITDKGITLTSPVESLFLPIDSIDRVSYSRLTRRLTIRAGRRRVKLHGVVAAKRKPQKVPLKTWLATTPPSRAELREGMRYLKITIDSLINSWR